MWSTWSESAKQALENAGDAITKAATNASKASRTHQDASAPEVTTTAPPEDTTATNVGGRYADEGSTPPENVKQKELLKSFQTGWSSVVESTKQLSHKAEEATKQFGHKAEEAIHKAEEAVKEQQKHLTERVSKIRSAYYKRDPKLPLDVPALQDAEVVYITDRLITMGHPAMASSVDGEITAERKLAAVGHLLNRRHDGRFMVWNISEVEYDASILDDQVLVFSFPGSPSPPLGLLLKLLVSMESWLKADDRNVAVVHCLTGKGRTSMVVAAFLCWMGQAGFSDIYQALDYIATCKQMSPDDLTIPSQRRYASYFKNMLDGVRPSQPPLMLKRIIMSEAPRFAKGPPRDDSKKSAKPNEDESVQLLGCAPYMQIFKAGKLLHTAPASLHFQQSSDELPFCQVADGSISFTIDQVVQGDILVRCRHLTGRKQRVSMFRAAFHTGYVPPNVMRITKAQLDGACSDDRFPDSFYLDLIFEAVDHEAASKLLQENETRPATETAAVGAAGETAQTLVGGATAVTASVYDTMLQRNSRFWDVIAARREEQASSSADNDPMWGSTVGRRREFASKEGAGSPAGDGGSGPTSPKADRNALETFSIGGEFDFLPDANEEVAPEAGNKMSGETPDEPKRDSLMEALMGALDDDDAHGPTDADVTSEEIVFEEANVSTEETTKAVNAAPKTDSTETGDTQQHVEASESLVSTEETTKAAAPVRQESEATDSSQAVHDMEALLADANLNLDDDMDQFLASGEEANVDDLLDFDVDDELADLEDFLSPSSKT